MAEYLRRFVANAERRPRHLAVSSNIEKVSYGELLGRARQFASAFDAIKPQARILIALPQGSSAYAAMLGAGLGGACYAPINVSSPLEKQRHIVKQFMPDAIVAPPSRFAEFEDAAPKAAFIDPEQLPATRPLSGAPPHELAYVIFTSGSTGDPKGVTIGVSALDHYVRWAIAAMDIRETDRWSQHPNLAFDLSVLDVYGALCGGATLFPLVGPTDRLMPATAIRRHGLTIWNSVPSVISLMMSAGQVRPEFVSSLRLMTFCGEPLLPEHLDAIFAAHPDVVVHNTYGPTEATVSCTLLRLSRADYRNSCEASVAIGEPIEGMNLQMLGGAGTEEGEIVITGPQLSSGYWNNPAATERAFRDVGVGSDVTRGYFTGDWAARRNGQLYFLGRRDFQVKIKGYRLELEEVDAAIRKCGVNVSCTVFEKGVVHAFIEDASGSVDTDELRQSLSSLLDSHAVPEQFHRVPRLPRSDNDKIDVRALKNQLSVGTPAQ